MEMKIKVCGMRDRDNIRALAELPIHYMGFIFVEKSPRNALALQPEALGLLTPAIRRVGVFVNAPFDSIMARVAQYGLHSVQLHGDEPPSLCQQLQERNLEVIKAFAAPLDGNFSATEPYISCADYLLFDTPSAQAGGSGRQFDWTILDQYRGNLPFFLSGGISPLDANRIKQFRHTRFAGIDINSRFELSPGEKNVGMVAAFVREMM